MFQKLLSIIIDDKNIDPKFKKCYFLTVSSQLHEMVCKFVIPLFKDNKLESSLSYEPKLIKKIWNFETCYSLSALMMLSGDHIRSMLMDFALSILKLYNTCCSDIFPGDYSEDIIKALPDNLQCFDYLLEFPEGIIFKTEILITYLNFKIFANGNRILEKYKPTELSHKRKDTFLDYMPDENLELVPNLIESELMRFSQLDQSNFEQEDLIEYLLRGIC